MLGGKKEKIWLYISLCANMVGDTETPFVILLLQAC